MGNIVTEKKSMKRLVICKSAGERSMRNIEPPAADWVRKSDNRHVQHANTCLLLIKAKENNCFTRAVDL